MKDSTKRSLRTAYHGLLAVLVGIPTWIPLFDTYVAPHISGGEKYIAFGAVLVAFAAAVSKGINKLEDAGLIPSVLKGADVSPADAPVSTDVPDVPAVPAVPDVPDVPVDEPVAAADEPVNTAMGAGNDVPTADPATPAADPTS